MPEIPELEAIRGFLTEHITGKAIGAVEVRIPVVVRTAASELREGLTGDVFGQVLRHGKFLLFPLASGRVLAINPMHTGRFQYVDPKFRRAAKTCIVVEVVEGQQLRYVDDRVMGKVYLLPQENLSAIPGWATNGPDLLAPAFTEEAWVAAMKRKRGRIKGILTDAAIVQGIGNAYSDEILWEAQINPYKARTELSDDDLRKLYQSALAVMEWATPLVRGAMVKDGVLDYEERRDFMRVHRLGGKPCPRCGATISEITANQRITSFCRTCQPGFVK